MTAVHHLQSKLKALKLSGMLDSLDPEVRGPWSTA
jgi:hypothetical protein